MKGVILPVQKQLIRGYSYLFTAVYYQTRDTGALIMPLANTETMYIF